MNWIGMPAFCAWLNRVLLLTLKNGDIHTHRSSELTTHTFKRKDNNGKQWQQQGTLQTRTQWQLNNGHVRHICRYIYECELWWQFEMRRTERPWIWSIHQNKTKNVDRWRPSWNLSHCAHTTDDWIYWKFYWSLKNIWCYFVFFFYHGPLLLQRWPWLTTQD